MILNRSRHGRAYLDVTAQGVNFQVVVGGDVRNIGGTSASTPAGLSLLYDSTPFLPFADSEFQTRLSPV